MSEIVWSQEQMQAIKEKGHILVSAAAGSGKTAILIERLINIVLKDNIDIDKLIVLTFTNAAASEMKQRFQKALQKEIEKNPHSKHLKKQLKLLPNAHISTIHSFCYSLIRENFYNLNISPKIQITSEEEISALRKKVLLKILEEEYEKKSDKYIYLVNKYISKDGDEALVLAIEEVLKNLESLPFKEEWIDNIISEISNILGNNNLDNYKDNDENENEDNEENNNDNFKLKNKEATYRFLKDKRGQILLKKIYENLEYLVKVSENLINDISTWSINLDIKEKETIQKILDTIVNDKIHYTELLKYIDLFELENTENTESTADTKCIEDIEKLYVTYNELKDMVLEYKFSKWPSITSKNTLKLEADRLKEIRTNLKDNVYKEVKEVFEISFSNIYAELKEILLTHEAFKDIILKYYDMYSKEKLKKNFLDYNDLEDYAIKLLYVKTEDGYKFSKIAQEIQKTYYEVQIDEYQDINLKQEYILNAITNNKLFQVGDPKQSIYGFRNSRPDLFVDKENTYEIQKIDNQDKLTEVLNDNEKESNKKLIRLSKNFRSYNHILEFSNNIFKNIMQKDTSIVEYTKEQYLNPTRFLSENPKTIDSLKTEILLINKNEEISQYFKKDIQKLQKEKFENENTGTLYNLWDEDTNEFLENISKLKNQEKQAHVIAKRILDLVNDNDIAEVHQKKLEFKDIAILLRGVASSAPLIENVLKQYNIPVITNLDKNIYEIPEVELILSYLKILDNPLQDLDMVAVLRSYFVDIDLNELIKLKLVAKKETIYECILEYIQIFEKIQNTPEIFTEEELKEKFKLISTQNNILLNKLKQFMNNFKYYTKYIKKLEMHKLLYDMIMKSGYYEYIRLKKEAIKEDDRILLYLDKVLEKTHELEKNTNEQLTLSRYISYIDEMKNLDDKVKPKVQLDIPDENAVKIMTIHKSKGLQFPVVILLEAEKTSKPPEITDIVYSEKLGLGFDIFENMYNIKYPSILKKVIQYEKQKEEMQEESRLLYVALTRAIEKLIIVGQVQGTVDEVLEKVKVLNTLNIQNEEFLPVYLKKQNSYLKQILISYIKERASLKDITMIEGVNPIELILSSYVQNRKSKTNNFIDSLNLEFLEKIKNFMNKIIGKTETTVDKVEKLDIQKLDIQKSDIQIPEKDKQLILDKLSLIKDDNLNNMNILENSTFTNIKLSVSEITSRVNKNVEQTTENTEVKIIVDKPKFMQEESKNIVGKERGTIIHSIFEMLGYISPNKSEEEIYMYIDELLKNILEKEIYTKAELEVVDKAAIYEYIKSEYYNFMYKIYCNDIKGKIYKEKAFYLEIDKKFKQDFNKEVIEGQVLQGVIDSFIVLEDEKKILLLDYKTDNLKYEQQFIDKYHEQLNIYMYALKKAYSEYTIIPMIYTSKFKKILILRKG